MPEIEVRPAVEEDIDKLKDLDHNYTSDHVWQLEYNHDRDIGVFSVNFHQVQLPRAVRVKYPRLPRALEDDWSNYSDLLVALFEGNPIGYVSLIPDDTTQTAWIADMAIEPLLRRKGVGSALIFAALEWADQIGCDRLVIETGPKNHPAIRMALKMGFKLCGYKDHYFPNHETGLFFSRAIG